MRTLMFPGMCVYMKRCAWICINENVCFYKNAYVPMSGRYVCVNEKMRVDMCTWEYMFVKQTQVF